VGEKFRSAELILAAVTMTKGTVELLHRTAEALVPERGTILRLFDSGGMMVGTVATGAKRPSTV